MTQGYRHWPFVERRRTSLCSFPTSRQLLHSPVRRNWFGSVDFTTNSETHGWGHWSTIGTECRLHFLVYHSRQDLRRRRIPDGSIHTQFLGSRLIFDIVLFRSGKAQVGSDASEAVGNPCLLSISAHIGLSVHHVPRVQFHFGDDAGGCRNPPTRIWQLACSSGLCDSG